MANGLRLVGRVALWLLIGALVLVLVAGIGGYLWVRGALPQTTGSVQVRGISAAVEIARDTEGVPHIRGATMDDALFGLGYAHAQDRLWQMEFQRRIGNGRLSEVLGETTLETDQFLRTLGPHRAAARAWANFTPDVRRPIEAYVAGVNAFISAHSGRTLPVEFTILGFAPEPWKPEDVLVWSKMMAWDLGGNWSDELLRAEIAAKLGEAQADELFPQSLAGDPLILPSGSDGPAASRTSTPSRGASPDGANGLLAIDAHLRDSLGMGGHAIGSNNWVVGGDRTTTGKPLLADDPHLGSRIPSIWYLAHLTGGDVDVIGSTLPGLPGVVIGRNQHIAWGVTNTGPDVQDLFLERIDGDRVEYNGAMEPLTTITEVIKVKGQPDVNQQVRITRHGPIISDVLDGATDPVAFRWTALDDTDGTFPAFLNINKARNWQEFTDALRTYQSPMQNFVYADTEGNIGYYAPGALPIRAQGDGTVPVPGWTGEYDWQGYVPFEELPHTFNPPEGYIVSANNRVVDETYPYLISNNYAAPYRAARIKEMIEAKPKLSVDDMIAMHGDVRSGGARALLPMLLSATPQDDRSRAALELVKNWDGTVSGESAAATVYQAWLDKLGDAIFADELGEELWEDYGSRVDVALMALLGSMDGSASPWCNDVTTPASETCADRSGKALAEGLAAMATLQGSDTPASWRWDKVHVTQFPHNPLDQSPLKPVFSRTIPNGGDKFTVNVAPPRKGTFVQTHIPSYRHVVDLANPDNSRYIQAVGQSGSVLSPHYADFIERWQRIEYLPMHTSRSAIDPTIRETLTLTP